MNTTNFLAFGGPKLLAFICGKHRFVFQIINSNFGCPKSWGKYSLHHQVMVYVVKVPFDVKVYGEVMAETVPLTLRHCIVRTPIRTVPV